MVVLVPHDSAWAARNVLTPDLLAEGTLVLGGDEPEDRVLHREILRALGGPPTLLHYAGRTDLLELVSLGLGYTLAGARGLAALPRGVSLRPLDSDFGWLTYCAFWPPGHEGPPRGWLREAPRA